jgi:hypothetical protein
MACPQLAHVHLYFGASVAPALCRRAKATPSNAAGKLVEMSTCALQRRSNSEKPRDKAEAAQIATRLALI